MTPDRKRRVEEPKVVPLKRRFGYDWSEDEDDEEMDEGNSELTSLSHTRKKLKELHIGADNTPTQ